jgi:glycosyltransferase involved in cell wall biosynthesis
MATYQGEKYIGEALKSVLDNINFLLKRDSSIGVQIIVADDGSKDNTEYIVREFVKNNPAINLLYVKHHNIGQAATLQKTIPLITGEIVCLLDSDDRFLPEKLETILQTFKENPNCGMVTHPQWIIDQDGRRKNDLSPKAAKLSTGNIKHHAEKTGSIIAPASSGLSFKTTVFKAIHPSPACGLRPCSGADSYLSLAASLQGEIIAIRTPLSEYRKHSEGKFLKRLSSTQGLKTQLELQERMEKHLGLKDCVNNNAYFARIRYVHDKVTKPTPQCFSSLVNLLQATAKDTNFKLKDKLLLLMFWSTSFLAPKKLFWKMWATFLKIR